MLDWQFTNLHFRAAPLLRAEVRKKTVPLVGGPFCGLVYDMPDNVVIIEESIEGTDRIARYHRITGNKGDVLYEYKGTYPNGDLIEPRV